MRTDKYMMAKAWMKQDQAPQAEALDTWNTLEAEFNEERKAMLMASDERREFKFGGGADAQMKGTEASRVFFKNRSVDKPTPTFEGPAGGAKLTGAKFANKTQEAEYIKLLEDRFKFPKGSNEARSVATNEALAKKFGITLNNVERINSALKKKLNLEYPAQTYEGREKIERERDKVRKENIKKTSSTGVESKIKRDIKKVDATALANDVDIAHRASLKANANLGANYLTTSLGIDAKVVNQKIIQPIEQKLGTLYELQKNLIKDYKPGDKIPKDVQKKLEKINIKISELADRTKGVLQGVLVDEKTLKPITYGVDYSKVLGFGLVDKPVSELTQADRDLIKLNVGEQIKTAKNTKNQKALLKKLTTISNNGGSKGKAATQILAMLAGSTVGAAADDGSDGTGGMLIDAGIGGGAVATLGTKTGRKIFMNLLNASGLPASAAFNIIYGIDPSSSLDRGILGAELAISPVMVKDALDVTNKIKSPLLKKIAQTLTTISPKYAMKAARVANPIGVAMVGGEIAYKVATEAEPNYYIGKDGEPTFYDRENASDVFPSMVDANEQAYKIAKEKNISYEDALRQIDMTRLVNLKNE